MLEAEAARFTHTLNSPTVLLGEHLTKTYGIKAGETTVLSDVSITVQKGSLYSISGPSGSGKSTLLNIVTGIDRPSSGQVFVNGEPLRAMSENALARWRGRNVGIIFQFFQLLPTLTALENILLATELGIRYKGRERRERAWYCLEIVGLAEYAKRLPSELSGGQQQRVAIARALANDPPLLIADEPTGNLDSKTATQIFRLFQDLTSAGKTVMFVTHDPALAAQATSGVKLLDGRIVAPS